MDLDLFSTHCQFFENCFEKDFEKYGVNINGREDLLRISAECERVLQEQSFTKDFQRNISGKQLLSTKGARSISLWIVSALNRAARRFHSAFESWEVRLTRLWTDLYSHNQKTIGGSPWQWSLNDPHNGGQWRRFWNLD